MLSLTAVADEDWTILRAIARRMLSVRGPEPFRHPSCDQYWQVERTAIRLAGYVSSGEITIDIVVPGIHSPDDDHWSDLDDLDNLESVEAVEAVAGGPGVDRDAVVRIAFDDGLEPILVPWHELDLVMEPAPRRK